MISEVLWHSPDSNLTENMTSLGHNELNCGFVSFQILKGALGMVAPDVEIDDGKGEIVGPFLTG